MGRKTKANRRVHHRDRKRKPNHRGRVTEQQQIIFGIGWLCNDPDCVQGIHHPDAADREALPDRERPAATNCGPFSDTSDLTSEDAGEHQGTD